MAAQQNKHLLPVKKSDRPLIGSGIEKNLAYQLSDTFAFKAKGDGTVESIDTTLGLMTIVYSESGNKEIIDISEKLAKNSNGGFYQTNQLKPLFGEGQKFKKGQIIAKNDLFFSGNKDGDIHFTNGRLSKIALNTGYGVFEDSSLISKKLSNEMSSKIAMNKIVTLGNNSNVQFIAKEGQKIQTGDPLIIFENDFDDSTLSDLLDKVGREFEQDIQDISSRAIRSKYSGVVKKINIYYNTDIDDMTESLQKIVKSYIRKSNRKNKIVNDTYTNNEGTDKNIPMDIDVPEINKINSDKIKGNDVEGVMFEFFIEYEDDMKIGDKVSFYTALKTVVSDVFPEDQSPYSEFRPDEEIEAVLSPLSVVSRMTVDVFLMMYGNKALLELKRNIADKIK